jgi:hypothetical protein
MNRYILIRRLTGPAILLLLGVVALLHQVDLVSWNIFVPLLLILIGVLKLAQRAALAAAGDEPTYPGYSGGYPGGYPAGYPGATYPYGVSPAAGQPQTPQQPGTSIVPTPPHDLSGGPQGGQS